MQVRVLPMAPMIKRLNPLFAIAQLMAPVCALDVPRYDDSGPGIKTGKGQGHGKPGTRSKAERNARKKKRRQRAKR